MRRGLTLTLAFQRATQALGERSINRCPRYYDYLFACCMYALLIHNVFCTPSIILSQFNVS